MVTDLSSMFIPARALSLSASSEAATGQALPESERWRVETVTSLRRALALRLRELAEAIRDGRTPTIQQGKDAFEAPLRSFSAVSDGALRKTLAPLRLRLEWLGMIGQQLGGLMGPANVVASGGAR